MAVFIVYQAIILLVCFPYVKSYAEQLAFVFFHYMGCIRWHYSIHTNVDSRKRRS